MVGVGVLVTSGQEQLHHPAEQSRGRGGVSYTWTYAYSYTVHRRAVMSQFICLAVGRQATHLPVHNLSSNKLTAVHLRVHNLSIIKLTVVHLPVHDLSSNKLTAVHLTVQKPLY